MIKFLNLSSLNFLWIFEKKKRKSSKLATLVDFFQSYFFQLFQSENFRRYSLFLLSCCTIFYIKTTDGLKNVGVVVLFYSIPFLLANFLSIKYSLKMPPLSQRTSSSGNIHAFTKGAIVRIHLKDFMLEWVLLYIG